MTSEELDEGRKIIIETDQYIFMEVLNENVAKYYGGKNYSGYDWSYNYRNGNLYFIINKTDNLESVSVHIITTSNVEVKFISSEKSLSLVELFKKYPNVEKFIMEQVDPFNMGAYFALKSIASGIPPRTDWTMELADDMIGKFKYLEKNPRNSIVTLQFNDLDDYFKTFEMSDDSLWVIKVVLDRYGDGFDFTDNSDDYYWQEGILLTSYLNESNKGKINEILKYISPGLELTESENENIRIVKVFDQFYPELGDTMNYEYHYLENISRNQAAKKEIKEEFCDIYEKYNIFRKSCYYQYNTPVWNLIKLYENNNAKDLSLYELIKLIGHKFSVGDYYESIYETYGEEFDDEYYQREISNVLDKILDKIEEDSVNFQEIRNLYNEISKKYKFNRWYDFPADPNKQFSIEKIDIETGKLVVNMYGKNFPSGKRKMSLEDFYQTIHNPSLF